MCVYVHSITDDIIIRIQVDSLAVACSNLSASFPKRVYNFKTHNHKLITHTLKKDRRPILLLPSIMSFE